jgi:hypothetical protein
MSLPDHVSHSQLSSWTERCQKAFFLQRIARAPETPAWWLLGGSAVHEVTEDLDRRALELNLTSYEQDVLVELEELFQENLDRQIREAEEKTEVPKDDWIAAGFRPKQDESYWRQNGPQMLSNWLQWKGGREEAGWRIATFLVPVTESRTNEEAGIEMKLESVLKLTSYDYLEPYQEKRYVVGAPDRIFKLPNGELVIVDVKSGSTTPKTVLQQGLYATLLEQEFGVRPRYGTFVKVGVKAGGVHTTLAPLAKYDERYFSQLFSAYRAQAETGTYLPMVGDMCDRCGVAAFCYAANGARSAEYDPLDPNYNEGQK